MTNIAQKPSDIVTLIKSEFQKVNDRIDALNESVNKEFLELNKRIARVEETILMATDEETLQATGTHPVLHIKFKYSKVESKFFSSVSKVEDLLELHEHLNLKKFYYAIK